MSLRELNIVNGVFKMRYYSLRMKLNIVIKDKEQEKVILENVKRCSKLVGKLFQVVFWHENLTENDCKEFVKRNEKLLFEVNTKITKRFNDAWFLIDSENEKSVWRYKHEGDILQGIVEYLKLVNHMFKRDNKK